MLSFDGDVDHSGSASRFLDWSFRTFACLPSRGTLNGSATAGASGNRPRRSSAWAGVRAPAPIIVVGMQLRIRRGLALFRWPKFQTGSTGTLFSHAPATTCALFKGKHAPA